MRRIFLALAAGMALAPMAWAGDCPQVVSGYTLETGEVVTLEGRSGDIVSIRFTSDQYSFFHRDQVGLVPVDAEGLDGPIVYDWTTPLPKMADLTPGATFHLEGSLNGDGQREAVAIDLKVVGPDRLTVGDCTLDVLKIEVTNWYAGEAIGLTTHYLHVPSLLVLRTEMFPPDDHPIINMAQSLQ
jgi:hypothetical protein